MRTLICIMSALFASVSFAQVQGITPPSRFGLGAGSTGVLASFNSGHWKLEPDIGISISHSDYSTFTTRYENYSLALDVLYASMISREMELYLGPRFELGMTQQKQSSPTEITYKSYRWRAGVFVVAGAEYLLGTSFGIGAEAAAGVRFTGRENITIGRGTSYTSNQITLVPIVKGRYYF